MRYGIGIGAACFGLLVACGSSSSESGSNAQKVSADEALNQVGGVQCERLKECFPQQFSTEFPKGLADCQERVVSRATPGRTPKCTQADIDTCIDDMKALECTDLASNDPTKQPASCRKC